MSRYIIIGGGPAGLTAALELLKKKEKDDEVIVLEESGDLGGISRTVSYHGNRMDLGGHRFFSRDEEIMKCWKSVLPMQGEPAYDDRRLKRKVPLSPGGPDPEKTDEVMLLRHRVSRIYYNNTFFDYPVSLSLKTIRGLGAFATIHVGISYLISCIFKRPEDNLENFYINRFGKALYQMFFEGYTEKLWGRHPREISADWGAQRVKGLSIKAVLKDMAGKLFRKKNRSTETSLIEEFLYPKLGPGQFWETVGREIEKMGGKICFHHRVKKIIAQNGSLQSVVCDTDEGEVKLDGDVFISSMPISDLIRGLESDRPIRPAIKRAAEGLPFRDFVTVGLLVRKLRLSNHTTMKTLGNIIPDCWIYVQDRRVKMGRIQIFNNWSPYMTEKPEETVWIGLEYFCSEGDRFWNMSEKACVRFAIHELVKMGLIAEEDVLDSHREKVKKAYPAYFDSYKNIGQLIRFLDSFDNLYCVGRNGQHRYNNMDHSMLTAMEAVRLIRSGSKDRTTLWSVNSEDVYHEEK